MINACAIGDCREIMREWIAQGVRVNMCVTSPPYWGLRDYGVEGQLGLERTPEEYVSNMVEVFRLVRELLADDGTLWMNMGDGYAANVGGKADGSDTKGGVAGHVPNAWGGGTQSPVKRPSWMKPKDLVGMPWRLAFALQADGWYLRSDIIWAKPNPMPESVTDRPTKAHEYVFLLAKQERYFYDAEAIAEPLLTIAHAPGNVKLDASRNDHDQMGKIWGLNGRRNRRSVWHIATEPYSEAHFATFPQALVEPCVLAGTSTRGHCPGCGKGWERVTERIGGPPRGDHRNNHNVDDCKTAHPTGTVAGSGLSRIYAEYGYAKIETTGWQPACSCNLEPVPGIVFDPFMGSGTVGEVAQNLGRRWLGCELNPEYARLQHARTAQQGLELCAS